MKMSIMLIGVIGKEQKSRKIYGSTMSLFIFSLFCCWLQAKKEIARLTCPKFLEHTVFPLDCSGNLATLGGSGGIPPQKNILKNNPLTGDCW